MHLAVTNGDEFVIKTLVAHGADSRVQDSTQERSLMSSLVEITGGVAESGWRMDAVTDALSKCLSRAVG